MHAQIKRLRILDIHRRGVEAGIKGRQFSFDDEMRVMAVMDRDAGIRRHTDRDLTIGCATFRGDGDAAVRLFLAAAHRHLRCIAAV